MYYRAHDACNLWPVANVGIQIAMNHDQDQELIEQLSNKVSSYLKKSLWIHTLKRIWQSAGLWAMEFKWMVKNKKVDESRYACFVAVKT